MKQEVKDKIEIKAFDIFPLRGAIGREEFIEGAEFGYNLAQEEYAAQSKGMRWVKASERLPEEIGKKYFIKTTSGKSTGTTIYNNTKEKRVLFIGHYADSSHYIIDNIIEWLDESTQEGGTVEATAIEVLAKHAGVEPSEIEDTERVMMGQDVALAAMTEYASQVSATDKKRIEELEKEVERLRGLAKESLNVIGEAVKEYRKGIDMSGMVSELSEFYQKNRGIFEQ